MDEQAIINLALFALLLLLSAYVLSKARSEQFSPQTQVALTTRIEELEAAVSTEKEERKREVGIEVEKRREVELRLRDAMDTIRSLNLTVSVLADRVGIKVPNYPSPTPPIIVAPKKNEEVNVIGVWAAMAELAKLDLRRDLETVMDAGGNWRYRPLIGKVTGAMLQDEFLVGGNADILYIAAHADDEGIYFSDQKYSPSWIAETASTYGVKLVFLNACRTRSAAIAVRRFGVRSVVYTLDVIDDKVAIAFAKAFFNALALGKTTSEAVASAERTALPPRATFGSFGEYSVNIEEDF